MSNPSFSNIDLWLFELAEGNLSEAQIEQLEMFLLQHPELDIDRDAWEGARVKNTEVVYANTEKHMRRKPVALYTAAGVTGVFLISLLGCYNYFGFGPESMDGQLAVNTGSGNGSSGEITKLKEQIGQLTRQVNELRERNAQLEVGQSEQAVVLDQQSGQNESSEGYNADRSANTASQAYSNNQNQSSFSGQDNTSSGNSGINNRFGITGNLRGTQDNNTVYSDNNAASQENALYGSHTNSERSLKPREARIIPFEPKWNRSIQYAANEHKSSTHESHISFKTKMDRMARSVQRMMDNPVALKNTRDPNYLVPGVLAQDVNFGAVGTLLTTRVQTLSRLQWYGNSNQQLMNQIAVDGYSYGVRGGFGIQLNHTMYNNGGIQVGDVALTYSPKFSVTNVISVEPSLRFKMGSKYLNNDKMTGISNVETDRGNVYDYYSNGSTPLGKQLWYKDLGMGLMVNTKWFFAGIQGDNLLHHKDNIYSNDLQNQRRAATEIYATVGTDWESRSERLSLSPYAVFHKNGDLTEGWLGANFRWSVLTVGAAVSTSLEPAASIGMKFKHFSISYNADYLSSSLLGTKSLSHQISLKVLGKTSRVGQRFLNY